MISFLPIFLSNFLKSNSICSSFKNVLTFLSSFLKSANKEQWHFMSSLVLIRNLFGSISVYFSGLLSILFSIFLLCLCILRNPAVFNFITCVSFLYRNYHSVTKKSRAISCHSLFPAWEGKQTWLLLNFVPTIDFTSSQFPAYGKRQYRNNKIC